MLLDQIEKRWSPRAFSTKEVSKTVLENIFLDASLAPSSFNEQPWRFIIGLKNLDDNWQIFFNALVPSNQSWNEQAPVLAVVVAKATFTQNGKPNPHAWYDCGQALGFLALQATENDVYLHQMAGFEASKLIDSFKIDSDYHPLAVFSIGYMGNKETLPDKLKENEFNKKDRKPIAQTVFSTWGKSFKF